MDNNNNNNAGVKIFSAIANIQSEIDAIAKNKMNHQQRFNFRGIDDVYNTLHPLLSKYKVFSVPEVKSREYEHYTSKSGTQATTVYLTVQYTFYTTDGSNIKCTVASEGSDFADKATNKALAFAHKYALLQVFSIPTEQMVDGDADSPTKAAPVTRKPEIRELSDDEKNALRKEYESIDVDQVIKDTTTHKKLLEEVHRLETYKPILTEEERAYIKSAIIEQRQFLDDIAQQEGSR